MPLEYVKNGEIALNISPNAVHKLQMGNELIEFSARFGGVARQISVPVTNVYALYARETGHGMTFDTDGRGCGQGHRHARHPGQGRGRARDPSESRPPALPAPTSPEPPKKPSGGRPTLRRIK